MCTTPGSSVKWCVSAGGVPWGRQAVGDTAAGTVSGHQYTGPGTEPNHGPSAG